jgi:predicted glycosyltransferase
MRLKENPSWDRIERGRMRIWYDAATGKQVRYGATLAKRFRKLGHEYVFTTREHPDTVSLAKALGEEPIVIGRYDPSSFHSRLRESANRMLGLLKLFESQTPDIAIAHQSIELCRIAFGLDVPIILTADTPHAEAANRLTVPLARRLVISEAIPRSFYKQFGAREVVHFRGVDEVAWVRDVKPLEDLAFEKPLIVVRQLETRASYAADQNDETLKLADELSLIGTVLFLSRYAKPKNCRVVSMNSFVDSVRLVRSADLVVSAGGTISREAALQGVPSVVISRLGDTYVNRYLAKKGFPIFFADPSRIVQIAKKYMNKSFTVAKKLDQFQNPIDIIENGAETVIHET